MCTIPMNAHSGYYDSIWLHDSDPIKGGFLLVQLFHRPTL